MTIAEMHINLDIGLNRANSNLYGNLLDEEKDAILNRTIRQLVLAVLNNEKNTVYNLLSYEDIRKYYSVLQSLIKTKELGLVIDSSKNYVLGELPFSVPVSSVITGDDLIYKDIKYKFLAVHGTYGGFLSNYGAMSSPAVGDEFTCSIDNEGGSSISIVKGERYSILNKGDVSSFSAGENGIWYRSTWKAIESTTATGWSENPTLEHLSDNPSWDDTTKIIPVNSNGYFAYISSKSLVDSGNEINSGTLTEGKKYRVVTKGSTDLSGVGGYTVTAKDTIFTCTSNSAISWDGTTQVIEQKEVSNRLVKQQDVDNFLQHSFGTAKSSPICTIADNGVRVYYTDDYSVNGIILEYIRKPNTVSKEDSVDCDLDESVHDVIVDLAVAYASGAKMQENYQIMDKESKESQQTVR